MGGGALKGPGRTRSFCTGFNCIHAMALSSVLVTPAQKRPVLGHIPATPFQV